MRIAILVAMLALVIGCTNQESQMDQEFDVDLYREKANNHLAALTQAHQNLWKIDSAESWDADQKTGILTWTLPDGVTTRAPFQIIGTYNSVDSTFLWAWDHTSVADPLRKDAYAVLEFARKHDVAYLQDRKVKCSEEDAWEFAALATLVCDQQGAYRGPVGTTFVYMTFGKVRVKKEP